MEFDPATAVTRFGALWSPPEAACRPLRAMAARHGVALRPVAPVEAAAAVLAADVWMLVTGSVRLSDARRCGPEAALVLSALLARAAGAVRGAPAGGVTVEGVSLPHDLREVERHRAAAVSSAPDGRVAEVVLRAASDLQAAAAGAGVGRELAGYGAALFLLEG